MSRLMELADKHRGDILALDDARESTVYGGLFDAFSAENFMALKSAGIIRCHIPLGCMAPLTKLTPKGRKLAAALRARAQSENLGGGDGNG